MKPIDYTKPVAVKDGTPAKFLFESPVPICVKGGGDGYRYLVQVEDQAFSFNKYGQCSEYIDNLMNVTEKRHHHEIAARFMGDSSLYVCEKVPGKNGTHRWSKVDADDVTWDPAVHYGLFDSADVPVFESPPIGK